MVDDQLCDTHGLLIEDHEAHQLRVVSDNRSWPLPRKVVQQMGEPQDDYQERKREYTQSVRHKRDQKRLFQIRQIIQQAPLAIQEAGADGLSHVVYWRPTWQDPAAEPDPDAFRQAAKHWRLDLRTDPDWIEVTLP